MPTQLSNSLLQWRCGWGGKPVFLRIITSKLENTDKYANVRGFAPPPPPPPPPPQPPRHCPPTFNIAATLRTFPKGTACGPSGLRVQHLLDALDSRLPISMESLLHQVVNILLAGNAPTTRSSYLAGGNLTSLLKFKGTGWDVQPIPVGEILRRLVGKCACILSKEKTSQFFNPFQFGVACPAGTEKIVHSY